MKLMSKILAIALLSSCSLSINAQDLKSGLKVYLKFDGSISDSSGLGNNPSSQSGSYTSDKFGNSNSALRLNSASSESLFIPDNSILNAEYTVSCWVKMESLPANNNQMVITSLGGNLKESGLSMTNNYFGYSGWGNYTVSQNSSYAYADGTLPNAGTWHHIISVRDNNSMKLYVDGVLKNSFSAPETSVYSGGSLGLYIGKRANNSSYANISIDEYRYYSRAISAAEVQMLYSVSNTISNTSIVTLNSFPNPTSGKFTIEYADINAGANIKIYNALGSVVTSASIQAFEGFATVLIEQKGLYFVEIKVGNAILRSKVTIQ